LGGCAPLSSPASTPRSFPRTSATTAIDLTAKLAGYIYVIEIKLNRKPEVSGAGESESTKLALAQVRARDYSAKYRNLPDKRLFELGLVFDSKARNLVQAD